MSDQERQQPPDSDPVRLAEDIESRMREYLARAGQEYPSGCQADWLSGVVADRILRPQAGSVDGAEPAPPTLDSLVKLCVYLMENLADVSNSYEEFYSGQLAELRDDCASAHAQVAALEDENGRLREQLHRRAEELRDSQAAVESLKLRNLAAAAASLRFDEAVAVQGDDDDEDSVDSADGDVDREEVKGGCRCCARFREAAERAEAEAASGLSQAAARNAALKADLADWEADMAEKVQQNVELAAQLEACQRMLARLGHGGRADAAAAAAATAANSSPRGIFGGGLLRKK